METDQQKDISGSCKRKFLELNEEELKERPIGNVNIVKLLTKINFHILFFLGIS